MEAKKKIAVIFPGIGYYCDKPLLYYSKKLAVKYGYEVREVPYGNFPQNVKGNAEKMEQAFYTASAQAEELLRDIVWKDYSGILFLSKSIGTAVSAFYASKNHLNVRNVFYTPVAQTFSFIGKEGTVFHGSADPWVETATVKQGCAEKGLPLYITEKANHSLETGDVKTDLANLAVIMEQTEAYISR